MMLLKGLSKLSRRNWFKYLRYLPLFLIIPFFLLVNSILEIKKIVCTENNAPCSSDTINLIGHLDSSSILVLRNQKLLADLNKIKPIKSLNSSFKLFNTLSVEIETEKRSTPINFALISEYPVLNGIEKPSVELQNFSKAFTPITFDLWFNGEITPSSTQSANILILSKQKLGTTELKDIYELQEIINKYLKFDSVIVLGQTVYFSIPNQPDIITSVPYDKDNLNEALQSLGFLTTIRTDPKVLDLRYKNPIVR